MIDLRKKAYAQVLRLLRNCDVALEVVDSRDINGTRIKKMDGEFRSKIIMVATKSDLLPEDARLPKSIFGIPVIPFSSRTRGGLEKIFSSIRSMAKTKKLEECRVVVFGLPNIGKSTIINIMRGRHSARTGSRPGVTKGPQWISLKSGILLYDTPGVVGFQANRDDLAVWGAIDIDKLRNPEDVAIKIIGKFKENEKNGFFKYYNVEKKEDDFEILRDVALNRGLLLKKGEPNIFEASKMIIRDFQKGRFPI